MPGLLAQSVAKHLRPCAWTWGFPLWTCITCKTMGMIPRMRWDKDLVFFRVVLSWLRWVDDRIWQVSSFFVFRTRVFSPFSGLQGLLMLFCCLVQLQVSAIFAFIVLLLHRLGSLCYYDRSHSPTWPPLASFQNKGPAFTSESLHPSCFASSLIMPKLG